MHLIAESGYNLPQILLPAAKGGFGFDAQWLDDFQHAVFALITGEREGYYKDYGKIEDLAETLNEAYLTSAQRTIINEENPTNPTVGYRQTDSSFSARTMTKWATASGRPLNRRSLGLKPQKLAAGLVLLSPYVPLLFMGEEYGETAPFLFFTDYQGKELADAIVEGRRREFAHFHWQGRFRTRRVPKRLRNQSLTGSNVMKGTDKK